MADMKISEASSLTTEEIRSRGEEWFEQRIKPLVESRPAMECVSIDVLTGEFATASEPLEAVQQLRAKQPQAVVWTRRVGFPYVHRFGAVPRRRTVELRRINP